MMSRSRQTPGLCVPTNARSGPLATFLTVLVCSVCECVCVRACVCVCVRACVRACVRVSAVNTEHKMGIQYGSLIK